MGLNFRYVMLIKQADEPRLLTHLLQVGSIQQLPEPFGTCLTLTFPLDDTLLWYLQGSIYGAYSAYAANRKTKFFLNKNEHRDHFPTDTSGRVGCIYLESKQLEASGYSFFSFDAATSAMSRLFQHSLSIRNWFLDLSSVLQAEATFLDLEEEGYEFMYRQGQPIVATLTQNMEVKIAAEIDQQAVVAICRDYDNLFLL
jgi:hypothetical protein